MTKLPAVLASVVASLLALFQPGTHPGFYKHIGALAPNVFFDHERRETSERSWVYRVWERIHSLKNQATDHFLDNYLKFDSRWSKEKGQLPAQNVSQRLASGAH